MMTHKVFKEYVNQIKPVIDKDRFNEIYTYYYDSFDNAIAVYQNTHMKLKIICDRNTINVDIACTKKPNDWFFLYTVYELITGANNVNTNVLSTFFIQQFDDIKNLFITDIDNSISKLEAM